MDVLCHRFTAWFLAIDVGMTGGPPINTRTGEYVTTFWNSQNRYNWRKIPEKRQILDHDRSRKHFCFGLIPGNVKNRQRVLGAGIWRILKITIAASGPVGTVSRILVRCSDAINESCSGTGVRVQIQV